MAGPRGLALALVTLLVGGGYAMPKEEEGEEAADVTPRKLDTSVFCIITFLLVMTILFEEVKDYMFETANKMLKPVVGILFAEMTVLGFLSLLTFCISKLDVLDKLSAHIFGESEAREEYLESLLEQVHYVLFAVMCTYIIQIMTLVKFG